MAFVPLDRRRDIVGWTAAPMFWLSLAFLVGQAILVVLWVDVPNLRTSAPAELPGAEELPGVEGQMERGTIRFLLWLWPVFWLESLYHWTTRPWSRAMVRFHFFTLMFCVCPSLRLCARSPEMDERIWLPTLGWRKADRRLRRHLERQFSVPMILIALLILPVLTVEFLFSEQVARYKGLQLFLHVGTGVIWFAFAAEFILMVSVAERKFIYIKEHWLDLAIILLPLLSFLRSLQVARASRLFRVAKIPQITKLARVYRLRGTALRALRGLLVLEVIQRLLVRNPEKLLVRMERRHRELEREARLLRRKILRLKREHELLERQESAGDKGASMDEGNVAKRSDGGQGLL